MRSSTTPIVRRSLQSLHSSWLFSEILLLWQAIESRWICLNPEKFLQRQTYGYFSQSFIVLLTLRLKQFHTWVLGYTSLYFHPSFDKRYAYVHYRVTLFSSDNIFTLRIVSYYSLTLSRETYCFVLIISLYWVYELRLMLMFCKVFAANSPTWIPISSIPHAIVLFE